MELRMNKYLLISAVIGSVALSPALANSNQLSASTIWFSGPGFSSPYERQVRMMAAIEMQKMKRGFYRTPSFTYNIINNTSVGAQFNMNNSTISGGNFNAVNCGNVGAISSISNTPLTIPSIPILEKVNSCQTPHRRF
jgi:hypothetical protein